MDRKLWLSLGVTLLPLPVVLVGSHVPLPGIDPRGQDLQPMWPTLFGVPLPPTGLGILALGLTPVLAAFLLVELAALVFPALRPLRHAREGRGKLRRAATILSLPIALMFAVPMASRMGQFELTPGLGASLLVVFALLGGTFVLFALADLVDRRGLTSGFGVVYVALGLPAAIETPSRSSQLFTAAELPGAPSSVALAGAAALVAIATIFVLRRPLTLVDDDAAPPAASGPPVIALHAPLSGLAPLAGGAVITSFVSRIREFGIPLGESGRGAARFFASAVGGAVLGAAIAFGLAYLFQSPARVQALWQRALRPAPAKKKSKKDPAPEAAAPLKSGPSEVREVDAPKDAYAPPLAAEPPPPYAVPFNQALVPTFAYLAVLGVTSSAIAAKVSLTFSIPTIAIAAALVLDAIDAARFLAKHGPAASVRAETRAFASDVALHVLQTTEIPAHARGRHLAVLLQVFPFTPVQILVPEAHAKTALKTLDRALGGSTRALPRNGTTASGAAG